MDNIGYHGRNFKYEGSWKDENVNRIRWEKIVVALLSPEALDGPRIS